MAIDSLKIPDQLREVFTDRNDTEGNLIQFDFQYELSNGFVSEAIEFIKSKHGNNIRLMPIGGQSAGGGVFSISKKNDTDIIVGLIINPPTSKSEYGDLEFTMSQDAPNNALRTNEIHIDSLTKIVYLGAGVTLEQLVATVKSALGNQYRILGTDLTSSCFASAGATFMTGGMGPTRTNFSRSVTEIIFYNGHSSKKISGRRKLDALVETYGWTGIVESIAVPIIEIPPIEFGFAIPINNTPEELSKLVAYFADKTEINNRNAGQSFIAGLEIITDSAIKLLEEENPDLEGLSLLIDNCKVAHKDSVVFVIGAANTSPFEDMDDPFGIFVDNQTSGLALEQATPFVNLQAMKNIRENAPELARRQFKDAAFSYKEHTDINIIINKNCISESVTGIVACYSRYKNSIEKLIEETHDLYGNMQVYGHINPQGFDPHYRITIASENENVLKTSKEKAQSFYTQLVKELNETCKKTNSIIRGGEKGIISNLKILNALNENDLPGELTVRLKKQIETIKNTDSMFNWRAKLKSKK